MFVNYDFITDFFRDKSVVIFGSGPSCFNNDAAAIDNYDVIVRVNNYVFKGYESQVGHRTDVFYSFFGSSIKKSVEELKEQGVKLCMSKLPNAKPIESEWHIRNKQPYGVDYRYIYKQRAAWWFTDTYIPETESFMELFNLLKNHQPTTGFAGIWELLRLPIKSLYITGFDFFSSMQHNGLERWRPKNLDDPLRHEPDREAVLLKKWASENDKIRLDKTLRNKLK